MGIDQRQTFRASGGGNHIKSASNKHSKHKYTALNGTTVKSQIKKNINASLTKYNGALQDILPRRYDTVRCALSAVLSLGVF